MSVLRRIGPETRRKAGYVFRTCVKQAGFIYHKVVRKHQCFSSRIFLAAKGLVAVPCALRLPPGAVMPHENAYLLTITRVEEQAAG